MKTFVGIKNSQIITKTKAFDVREQTLLYSDGSSSQHITVLHPGAVVMIPQVAPGRFLMLKQYRHSIEQVLLEFPAGTLRVGEDPLGAAKRELIEEINHNAAEWIELGRQYPTPGICNELQYCYLARNLSREEGALDDDELIEVVEQSSKEIEDLIADGSLIDAKSIAIYTKAKLRGLI